MIGLIALFLASPSAPEIVPMAQEKFHHLLFANATVAVFDVVVPPGATMRYHAHPTNHLAVVIAPGRLRNEVIGHDPIDRPTGPPGTVVYIPTGDPHRQTNLDAAPVRFIAVEIQNVPAALPGPAAPETAPGSPSDPGCHVILVKPQTKVTRCLVAAGMTVSTPHAAGFLRVPIDAAGTPAWLTTGSSVTNTSPSPMLFVDLDF